MTTKQNWFFPLSGKTKRVDILAFDIEGTGQENGFICGAIEGAGISNWFTDREDMFGTLLDYGRRGYWLFAHNLEYDLPILGGDRFWDGNHLFTTGGLLWAEYNRTAGKAKFFDSTNIFRRTSVFDLGLIVNRPKLDLPPDILRKIQRAKPWYKFPPKEQRLIQSYCRQDAEIVYLALEWLQDILIDLGGQMRPTIAGIAMDLYRRKFLKYPWKSMSEELNTELRPGYYGGRVENFAYGKIPAVNMYDINSLYPFAQSKIRFAHPSKLEKIYPAKTKRPYKKWSGMAKATVKVPDCHIPPLPHRYRNKLFFPVGEMHGIWTLRELRVAEELGCDIKSVDWVIGTAITFNPFTRFVETLFDKRQELARNRDTREKIIKLIANSLYGRFGLNPDNGLLHIKPYNQGENDADLIGYTDHIVNDQLICIGPLERKKFPEYINVMIAAQIAAESRIYLLRELLKQGQNACYCDTDSIITQGRIRTGKNLGEWKLQMAGGSADLLGPKEYALHNINSDPEYVAKGVPAHAAEQYLKEGLTRFSRALKVRESITNRKNPGEWVETFRHKDDIIPKRAVQKVNYWLSDSWSPTIPWNVDQLEGVCDRKWKYRKYSPWYPDTEYPLPGADVSAYDPQGL